MTISFDLQPDIERGLSLQAQAKGISLSDFVKDIVVREVNVLLPQTRPQIATGQVLVDVCKEIQGLLNDKDIDEIFTRRGDHGREIEL